MLRLIGLETRRLVRDRAAFLALLVLVLGCAIAFMSGRAVLASQTTGRSDAEMQAARRLDTFKTALRNQADPTDALSQLGRLGLPAIKPLAPLVDFTVGQAASEDYATSVTASSRDDSLFRRAELTDPAVLSRGSLDLAFVVVWLAPLILIGLGYGLFTADRDSGAARLILAQGGDALRMLAARSLPRLLLVAAPIALTVGLLLLLGPSLPGRAIAALQWVLAAVLLQVFWWSVILLINSLKATAETAALGLIALWAVFTLVLPTSIDAAAELIYPPPSQFAEIVASRRAEAIGTATYENAHAGDNGENYASVMKELHENAVVEKAAERVLEPINIEYQSHRQQRDRLVHLLDYLSPSLLAANALADSAGSDAAREDEYKELVVIYRSVLTGAVDSMTSSGRILQTGDYAKLPTFRAAETTGSLGLVYMWFVATELILLPITWQRFRRIRW